MSEFLDKDGLDVLVEAFKKDVNDARSLADAAQKTADEAMPKSGGTFTGSVILYDDPTQDLEAATKEYVDAASNFILKVEYDDENEKMVVKSYGYEAIYNVTEESLDLNGLEGYVSYVSGSELMAMSSFGGVVSYDTSSEMLVIGT